ncbi:MAG: phosphatidate cytidylyltransferase [Parvibaculum sp.]|uniref:phosphatidate cytidylyltransferase n=1 Tax=Parvibaculum sp. TaxID=2024848 RepID=UPI0025FD4896|nr:phosphatidate cytidylyltransferase [Parvibaculum sp.]MCE9651416.1 phosphatidate cytidylyltransferase [Parvibaculum sp.]
MESSTASKTAPSKSAELRTRILSALVLAPVALGLAWVGGWPFAALLAVAAVAMALELTALLPGDTLTNRVMLAGFALIAVLLTAVGGPFVALLAGMAGLTFAVTLGILRSAPVWPPLLAYPYLILPLVALLWLRLDPAYGRIAIFWLLFVVWATDTFAYFAGRAIGGPKLAPLLSPNKTWAGLVGGMFGAVVVGATAAIWLDLGSPALLALVSAVLAVVAQAGDILESALKRRAGVKDSGKLIPGHGGILDRVDGLVTAAVAAALIALLHGSMAPGMGVLVWP